MVPVAVAVRARAAPARTGDSAAHAHPALAAARVTAKSSKADHSLKMPPMMKSMTLYSGPLSMYGAKVHIAALEKGFPVHVVMVPFTEDHRYDPKHPQVIRINPKR